MSKGHTICWGASGMGRFGGAWGTERGALDFWRVQREPHSFHAFAFSLRLTHTYAIRTRTHFADYLIAANVSTKAASKSTKQNSNSSKAQAWNACALILERGRGVGAQ